MVNGGINHLALVASNLERSQEFYRDILGLMGYAQVEVPEATQAVMKTRLLAWASPQGSVRSVRRSPNLRQSSTIGMRPASTMWRSVRRAAPPSMRCTHCSRRSVRKSSMRRRSIRTFQAIMRFISLILTG